MLVTRGSFYSGRAWPVDFGNWTAFGYPATSSLALRNTKAAAWLAPSILRRKGFPPKFCAMVQAIHTGTTVQFMANGELSRAVKVTSGIRQGCPLAPLLFILAVDLLYDEVEGDNAVMKKVRGVVKEAYKDLAILQRYQILVMSESKPGVVSCRVGPADEVVNQDLRRVFDGIHTDAVKLRGLLENHLETLQPPAPNFEKKQQMHDKIRPYVPREYASDPIYDTPTDEEERLANETKQARRKANAQKKTASPTSTRAEDAPTEPTKEQATENEDLMKVARDSSAQPKTGKQSRKRAKKDK